MSDEFRIPPAKRKEPSRFEPPPWERDAFEEMSRRRAEQEAESEKAAAAQVPGRSETAAEEHPPVEDSAKQAVPSPSSAAGESRAEPSREQVAGIDDSKVSVMLMELAVTERVSARKFDKAAMVLMAVTAAIGAVLIVWGGAALAAAKRMGQVGVIGGIGLIFFGALFLGVSTWMAVRTLRQRGVL